MPLGENDANKLKSRTPLSSRFLYVILTVHRSIGHVKYFFFPKAVKEEEEKNI